MILTDQQILKEIKEGRILIEPFNENSLGTNSYDVHLGRHLLVYTDRVLDARQHNQCEEIIIQGLPLGGLANETYDSSGFFILCPHLFKST